MSPSSVGSTSSWRGGGGATLDIIDLDQYMRGHVRGAPRHNDTERLVVDAGGGNPRKLERAPATAATSETSNSGADRRNKRYSHDSGLSDGSYTKKRRQTRRRMSAAGDRSVESGPRASLRNFRAHTERALKEQQEQIARVAEICERLAVRGGAGGSDSGDSSDVTSSSSGERRRDVRECRTYKIIMSKLDELNRLFAVRARTPALAGAPTTCSANTYTLAKTRTLMERAVGSDVGPSPLEPPKAPPSLAPLPVFAPPVMNSVPPPVAPPVAPLSRLTPALALQVDIAPDTTRDIKYDIQQTTRRDNRHDTRHDTRNDTWQRRHSGTLNVATESILHYSSQSDSVTGDTDSAGTSLGTYHLDDPLKLYAQAKRLQTLQALQAQTLRGNSLESSPPYAAQKRHLAETIVYNSSRGKDHSRGSSSSPSGGSVCALCRRYWRALTRCLHTLHNVT